MKKIITAGLTAGITLLIFSLLGLYLTISLFPNLAMQYFDPAFDAQSSRYMIYFIHPFIISLALSWFWDRFKGILSGSFITRGIEFGFIYMIIAVIPMMWLIYSAMNVSLAMIATWSIAGLLQGVIAGLVFEKMNP
jgi:hypothetical protein